MNKKIKTIINNMKNKQYKVTEVNKVSFTLENGDTYPHTFELGEDITIEEFQTLLDKSKDLMLNLLNNIEKETDNNE